MSDKYYELLHEELDEGEEIVYINFIEDIVPKYLFVIINNTETKESFLHIKFIKKN